MTQPISATLLELERSIQTLSFDEKLWLLERITRQLQMRTASSGARNDLAEMAADSAIQSEVAAIDEEFAIADAEDERSRSCRALLSGFVNLVSDSHKRG
jgi:hypothetical protein